MDPVAKLTHAFKERPDEFGPAFTKAFETDSPPQPAKLAKELFGLISGKWKIDFLPYDLDHVESKDNRGKLLLNLIQAAYADEMEDTQAEIGTNLRKWLKFLQAFSPKLDFLSEISPDNFVRRPLERLWQMEPIAIFEDMSVTEDAEADALLGMLEKIFVPILPDIASTAEMIRRDWYDWMSPEDANSEVIFYELVERSITHAVQCESRIAEVEWVFRNLDENALLIGALDVTRHGLTCLSTFCSNCKFFAEHSALVESVLGEPG